MRSRSAPGSSTPTWRPTSGFLALPLWGRVGLAAPLLVIAGVYVVAAFIAPSPLLRIVLRSLPFLPIAIWTIWLDRDRPLEHVQPSVRFTARLGLLLLVMALVVALLGVGLNWLYDPTRVL